MNLQDTYIQLAGWLNANTGVIAVTIFVTTLILGWVSGIFTALRKKPKFRIGCIPGPTFSCTYPTGEIYEGHEAHITGIAMYLEISNIGASSSGIKNISVAYHWHLKPFSILWLKYKIGWYWIDSQAVALEDFRVKIGESIKVYPFLNQCNNLSPVRKKTYLEVREVVNGVVYFEQEKSWGGRFPSPKEGNVKVKVAVTDVFERRHAAKFSIPAVALHEAKKYNPSFGITLASIAENSLPQEANESNE